MWEELANEAEEPYMREMARRYIEKLRGNAPEGREEPPVERSRAEGSKNDI
jgi:hypothetical protein